MIRVSDYIARTLVAHGVKHVFMVTGGGAMHLNDAFGRCEGMKVVCCHHEQTCSIAADAYNRIGNELAAVNVTSGPGGTNAITGAYGAFVDSLAMVVVSGNVKWETLARSTTLPLRSLGDQEVDIIRLVESITKYSVCLNDPKTIRFHLEKALYLAKEGRPGPVWLDVPMNIQGAMIDPDALPGFVPPSNPGLRGESMDTVASQVVERIRHAKRPVILASAGVWRAGAQPDLLRFAEKFGIPVTTAWNSHDLVWDDHPLYAGRPGIMGDRAGNFAVQNSDLLISVGCRLSIRQVSYDWKQFARDAFKIVVDIDAAELAKPTICPDMAIHADAGEFLRSMNKQDWSENSKFASWASWCRERRAKYPVVQDKHRALTGPVNPYGFIESLFQKLDENDVVVCGNGTACVATFQAAIVKKGQRLFHNSGSAPMGFDLPAVLGAWYAGDTKRERIVCITGDGSLQMNLQELQTLLTHRIPVKLFVLNNDGYHSIRQTQNAYFSDSMVGFEPSNGVEMPNLRKIAEAYGFRYVGINSFSECASLIPVVLTGSDAVFCEVFIDKTQNFEPKLASKRLEDGRMVSSPLEDMYPFLDPNELADNMISGKAKQ